MSRAFFDSVLAMRSAHSSHLALSEQQPVDGHLLLERERDQEVRVRRRSALVAVHVLLEYAEVARELALGTISPDCGDAIGEFSLESLDCGCGHLLPSSF